MSFAASLLTNFHQAIDRATLEKAIQLYHEALTLWPVSHTHRWRWLWELSEVLLMQFHITGDLAQLDEAICHLREVQRLQPNRRFCLLAVLTTRNQRAMVLENLVEVNGLMESAAQSDQEATELFHTGQDFYRVFQQSGDILAIDSAAIKLQAARWQASWGHPLLSSVLIVLSNVLHVQFEQKGDVADIDIEIGVLQELLALQPPPHPSRSNYLNSLAKVLSTRFSLLGDPKDLDKSIALCREALALQSPPHPGRSKSLNNLAATVLIRFGQQGDPMDIDESIALYEEALALQAHPHLKRSISLNNFSAAIWTRFGQRGDPKDVEQQNEFEGELRNKVIIVWLIYNSFYTLR
jgi:tetratricopeptide (TPR) repeat protein